MTAEPSPPAITKARMLASPAMASAAKLEFYVIFTRPAGDIGAVMAQMQAHLAHQLELERTGVMFAAGPLFDENDEWHGDGMVIVRADSIDHARDIAASDPMHSSGARTFTVQPWVLNEGSLSVNVSLSSSSARLGHHS